MADRLTVVPADLCRAAEEHRATAERLAATAAGDVDIMATLESLGPVFGDLRDAGRVLLAERRACYEQQADAHRNIAERLTEAAGVWQRQDAEAARRLRGLTGEHP